MNAETVRAQIIEVIDQMIKARGFDGSNLQVNTVLGQVARELSLNQQDERTQQVLLTVWNDLFRTGHLSWGFNLNNPGPPWFHLSEKGRRAMERFSRDPANPAGYMAQFQSFGSISPIATSYAAEAVATYNAECVRASAVMIGGAAERLVLDVRDALIQRLEKDSRSVSSQLQDWRVAVVLKSIRQCLDQMDMPRELRERYETHWNSFVGIIRTARNNAGHPTELDPVTEEVAHSTLLIFPELARLSCSLMEWLRSPAVH